MRIQTLPVIFIFLVFIFILSSCKKESLLTNGGELRFSADTLTFDTVFTAAGSFTLGIKIFNKADQKIRISSVRLDKGNNSFFHLNVDGAEGNNISNVNVAANDSFYVFATVNIDPTNENNPFVIEDKLIATLNGKEFSIPLIAYGQNAHYITDSVIEQNDTWLLDKPYVIVHSALIEKGFTLNIPAGCRIYMNADSRLFVFGNLIANGTKKDSIIFQGNRLDRGYFGYEGYPGEWGGIYFDTSSKGNIMNWCILRNCGNLNFAGGLPFAIQVNGYPGIPTQLTMNNTIIENSIGHGILSFGGNIKAQNCLVHTCGAQALAILKGGNYEFDNCDFLIYYPTKLSHIDNPTVAVLNYFSISNTEYLAGDLTAQFRNCMIYGSLDNELVCDKVNDASYNVTFDHCLVKSKDAIPAFVTVIAPVLNQDPLFEDYKKWNYRPKADSPVKDAGTTIGTISHDLDDQVWLTPFDIGCYQAN